MAMAALVARLDGRDDLARLDDDELTHEGAPQTYNAYGKDHSSTAIAADDRHAGTITGELGEVGERGASSRTRSR